MWETLWASSLIWWKKTLQVMWSELCFLILRCFVNFLNQQSEPRNTIYISWANEPLPPNLNPTNLFQSITNKLKTKIFKKKKKKKDLEENQIENQFPKMNKTHNLIKKKSLQRPIKLEVREKSIWKLKSLVFSTLPSKSFPSIHNTLRNCQNIDWYGIHSLAVVS